MRITRLFTDHPASLGESYLQHYQVTMSYARPLAIAAAAAAVHAIFPFLFKTTASATIRTLNDRIAKRCAACPVGPAHRPDLFDADRAAPVVR